MSVTGGLSVALAVFIGLEGAALALLAWPPAENRRTHAALIGVAVLILLALSLLTGNG